MRAGGENVLAPGFRRSVASDIALLLPAFTLARVRKDWPSGICIQLQQRKLLPIVHGIPFIQPHSSCDSQRTAVDAAIGSAGRASEFRETRLWVKRCGSLTQRAPRTQRRAKIGDEIFAIFALPLVTPLHGVTHFRATLPCRMAGRETLILKQPRLVGVALYGARGITPSLPNLCAPSRPLRSLR